MTCGIYQILNTETRKRYIGASVNVGQRWQTHKYRLRNGEHANDYLLDSWNKYGENVFELELVKEVSEDDLRKEEEKFFQAFLSSGLWDMLYNVMKDYDGGRNFAEETKEKLSKEASKRVGEKNSFYGKSHTEETKNKLAKIQEGRYKGSDNPFYGKSHSKETKQKISKSKKGSVPPNRKQVYAEGDVYKSLKVCADAYDMSNSGMQNRLKSDNFPQFYYLKNS